ncbi:MAG: hypothetical protein WDZ51_17865 [Pirellulaceae bacterium]
MILAVVLWGFVVTAGTLYGLWYETTPAVTSGAVTHWPESSSCQLSAEVPTLLMFVHPRCPCSRASLNELALLMTHCQGKVDTQVLFLRPTVEPDNWAQTDLWKSAERIPGVIPQGDFDGAEHRRFGAKASGEVFLFQPDGTLSFHGGITSGRGHEGDNPGRLSVERLLLAGDSAVQGTPVFGCQLECPGSTASELSGREPSPATNLSEPR